MAWRFVRQPNGLLAAFSSICDDFTDYDLSPVEAADVGQTWGLTRADAWVEVGSAIDDAEPWTNRIIPGGDGLTRWRDCLKMIRHVHGKAEAEKVERELGKAGG